MAECRWCGERATTVREVVPADVARDGTVRRAAICAEVCHEHAAMVDRNVRGMELEKLIRRLNGRLARCAPHTSNHKMVVSELGAARLELAELNSSSPATSPSPQPAVPSDRRNP